MAGVFDEDANAIPAGAIIDSATLRTKLEYRSNPVTINVHCHRMAPVAGAFTVNYAAATRNSYNGTASAWTGGANAAGDVANSNNDYLDTADSVVVAPLVGVWMDFNVTSSVQAFVSGTANNGWLLRTDAYTIRTSTTNDTQGSTEYAELVVTYH